MEACRNLGPSLLSVPIAVATSEISAPVTSQTADIELMLDIRCALTEKNYTLSIFKRE